MKHYCWEDMAREQMNPLFARRVIHGERLTLAQVFLKKGCKVPLHSHENEQISNVYEGRLRFEIDGREQIVGPGEAVHIPPGVPHLAEALDDCVCLDVFTPVREDWRRGDDAYLRREAPFSAMDLGISNRVAVVAASSRGLGKAVAEALAAEGVRLALCARDEKTLRATADAIRARFRVPVLERALDVRDLTAVKSFVAATLEAFGTVDIGVANAGGPPSKSFAQTTLEDWRDAFDLNFMSTLYLVRELLPYMQKQKWGRIVAITSITTKQPTDGLILSNAIRAAVTGLIKSLSNEYARENILLNCVCPGFTVTDRLTDVAKSQAAAQSVSPQEIIDRWSRNIPLGRLGKAEEFGAVVAFLCSEKAGYVTGSSIAIDGGAVKGIH